MQKIERILGLRARVCPSLPPFLLSELGPSALEVAKAENLNPDDYLLYRHRLVFSEHKPSRFLKNTRIAERIARVALAFFVNEKQMENGSIIFCNDKFRAIVKPDYQYAKKYRIRYSIEGSELLKPDAHTHEIVTLIRRSLPLRHRKLKLNLRVSIAEDALTKLPEKFRKTVITELDIRYVIGLQRRTESLGAN